MTHSDVSRLGFAFGASALAAIAAAPAFAQATLSAEDRATLAQAQTYLQGLTSARGTFSPGSGEATSSAARAANRSNQRSL